MKDNKKFKKILISLGLVFVALQVIAWCRKKKHKKDAFLKEDAYEGAGKPKVDGIPNIYEAIVKPCLDKVLSFLALVILAPIFGLISLCIYVDDPGPVIFRQKRVGVNKTFFYVHKFRSMKMSTPSDIPTHQLEDPDQYITRVGKIIRKLSLDELPQIWDIFVGDMSIVGPRPALWNQADLVAERDIYGANDVKPGLTGWAQINGRDELEIPVKAAFDGEYVTNLKKNSVKAFMMDVKCFFGTFSSVLGAKGVVEGGTGSMGINDDFSWGREEIDEAELIGDIGFGEVVRVSKLAEKRVLILGKDSFIGESFQNYAKAHYGENFTIDVMDMRDESWREHSFADYDIVFNVAGIAHSDTDNISTFEKKCYYDVNADLAVDAAKKAKRDGVKTFIHMSSMIVYGASAGVGEDRMIRPDSVPMPENFYGDSKLKGDVYLRRLATTRFKVIVLRPPMIYGDGSKGNYKTLEKIALKSPVFPNIHNDRSMLYIDNLCELLCQVMLISGYKRKAVVLMPQDEEWVTTSKMVADIAKENGKKIWVTGLINPFVYIASLVPGKMGKMTNKAFGSMCYDKWLSIYPGIKYQRKN